MNLINAQSNTFTAMDLEVAFNGIKLDSWSIQNTFSAIFVANCDSLGATFDNSSQATNGKTLCCQSEVDLLFKSRIKQKHKNYFQREAIPLKS